MSPYFGHRHPRPAPPDIIHPMVMTSYRSQDNGVYRPAVGFSLTSDIGVRYRIDDIALPPPKQWVTEFTQEFDDWCSDVMHLPGFKPITWWGDPHYTGWSELEMPQRLAIKRKYGSKRLLAVFDTEEQCLMFKMRWS